MPPRVALCVLLLGAGCGPALDFEVSGVREDEDGAEPSSEDASVSNEDASISDPPPTDLEAVLGEGDCDSIFAGIVLDEDFDEAPTATFRGLAGEATIEDRALVIGPDALSSGDPYHSIHSNQAFDEVGACIDMEFTAATGRINTFALGLRLFQTGATLIVDGAEGQVRLITFEPERNVTRGVKSMTFSSEPQQLRLLHYRSNDHRYVEVFNRTTGEHVWLAASHMDSAPELSFEAWELDHAVRIDFVRVGFLNDAALDRVANRIE